MNEPDDGLTEHNKASILRAAAVDMRDSLEQLHLGAQVDGYDDEDEAHLDHLRTARAMDLIARDLFAHGIGPSFGTHAHFEEQFLGDRPGYIEGDQLKRVREVLEHASALQEAPRTGICVFCAWSSTGRASASPIRRRAVGRRLSKRIVD